MTDITTLANIASAHRRKASELLRPFEITYLQFSFIQLARQRGHLMPSQAAKELECDRPTITLVARKCVSRGWLQRKRSSTDRRSVSLRLTGEGEALLDSIEAAHILAPDILGDPLDILDSEERALFHRVLEKVHRRAQDLFA